MNFSQAEHPDRLHDAYWILTCAKGFNTHTHQPIAIKIQHLISTSLYFDSKLYSRKKNTGNEVPRSANLCLVKTRTIALLLSLALHICYSRLNFTCPEYKWSEKKKERKNICCITYFAICFPVVINSKSGKWQTKLVIQVRRFSLFHSSAVTDTYADAVHLLSLKYLHHHCRCANTRYICLRMWRRFLEKPCTNWCNKSRAKVSLQHGLGICMLSKYDVWL